MARKNCELSIASNRFTLELFARLTSSEPQNIFISGYSVNVALTMLALGAEGESLAQLKDSLHWSVISDSEDKVIESYNSVANFLNSSNSIKLLTATSVWSKNFREEYIHRVQDHLGSDAFLLQTENEINDWVSQKTNALIPKILETLDPATVGVLINAIYFKGSWKVPFTSVKTTPAQFLTGDKELVTVPMMHLKGNFRAVIGKSGPHALELPYFGDEYSMVAILPASGQSWSNFIESSESIIKTVFQDLSNIPQLKVSFPKFKLEYGTKDIKDELKQIGIENVFGNADLSRMSNSSVNVSSVLHKAVCIVNEEGTEAAAATAIPSRNSLVGDWSIKFNKHFLFVIRDNKTNMILFIGIVSNPLKT